MFKLLILFLCIASISAKHTFFYRKDYTYVDDFDAYYKLHWDKDGKSWNSAFLACDDEGSQLFYPKEEGEWVVVKNLTSMLAEAPNTTDVIVGIHDEIGQGEFVNVDGTNTQSSVIEDMAVPTGQDCVIMDMETGQFKAEPCVPDPPTIRVYVCKKVDEKPCPTIDLGYQYVKEMKKCYKVNKHQRSWQEAWHTCFMEGGLLVSPESSVEADIIQKIISTKDAYYFSGFRKIPGSDYYTVKGKKLEDSGFNRWRARQDEDMYNCGVIYSSSYNNLLYVRSQDCNTRRPFMCEMPAKF
ncbi:lectin c-type domain-containing protein [Phthorimaea operculella]|nr:lectin c-type domain-containing protein [Phthorimaea operculella]